MKHIQKKYGFLQKSTEAINAIGTKFDKNNKESLKLAKKSDIYITTDKGYTIKSFLYQNGNKSLIIPIPDLSLVYFDSAYHLNRLRKNQEELLFKKLEPVGEEMGENSINEIYRYYGFASSCSISLSTSMESFINHIIPDDKTYEKILKNKTEIYNKQQIQRDLNFDEKLRKVLPYFFQKDYFIKQTTNTQLIFNLKELRDEIVHPKNRDKSRKTRSISKKIIELQIRKNDGSCC
jgi:hypothetical protein